MTKLLTQTFIPFSDAFQYDNLLKSDEAIDPYERPTDFLGTHYVSFSITQKATLVGTIKRKLYLDFYRKRIIIRGSFEGPVFEARGTTVKEYRINDEDRFLITINFLSKSIQSQSMWFDSNEDVKAFMDSMAKFLDICKTKRNN